MEREDKNGKEGRNGRRTMRKGNEKVFCTNFY